jgi:DNA-binding MarR family transcriptional regulator
MDSPRPIGFWLKLVDRMIDEQFASTLEEHGVTRRQWQLLSELSRGPASVEQLDAAVAPFLSADDHESSVEHLTELIDSGWVDATEVGYEITDRGHIAAERLAAVVDAQRALATEGVTPEQYEATIEVLERVARNLGWSN